MEEINNFQQEPDESLISRMHEDIFVFTGGLDVPTQQILDSKGVIPSKTATDAKVAIQEMAEYSQKWHNGTSSRTKGPHYTKDCPQKEEGKTLKEAYYTQFGTPYQPGGQYRATRPGFYQRNNGNSLYLDRRASLEESLTKFMAESAKRHSNIIKEIRASTDAAIRNQGASIKTLELQIEQMSKVLQERGFRSLPSATETNPRDQVKAISTARADFSEIHGIEHKPYTVSEAHDVMILDAHSLPQKEKDPGSFTLPCFIRDICLDKALVDLGESVSVMILSNYTNLGIGILSHTRLPHPGQGILGPAPTIYASQPTPLPNAFSTMPPQDLTWHMDIARAISIQLPGSNNFPPIAFSPRQVPPHGINALDIRYSVLTDHQLDTTYKTFCSGQRIEFYSRNGVSALQQYNVFRKLYMTGDRLLQLRMVPSYNDAWNGNGEHNNSRMNTTSELKISDEFLKILQDNAFNGMDGEDE
ncbi:hypothetical protein Tco_0605438 [Tanacetum coccineum]